MEKWLQDIYDNYYQKHYTNLFQARGHTNNFNEEQTKKEATRLAQQSLAAYKKLYGLDEDNNTYNAGQLQEVTVTAPRKTPTTQLAVESDWDPGYSKFMSGQRYYADDLHKAVLDAQRSDLTNSIRETTDKYGKAIGLTGTALVGGALAASVAPEMIAGINAFKAAHPYLSTAIDVGLTADGVRNFFTDEGVKKTKRFIDEGRYGRAALSGVGDVLDIAGASDLVRVGSKIFNPFSSAYRRVHAYHNIPQFGYENTLGRINDYVKALLSGVPGDPNAEAKWVKSLKERLLNGDAGYNYLLPLTFKNPEAAAEIAVRGRDEASRLYNGLPLKHNYYIKNADGSFSYNLKQIEKDWKELSGETEFPLDVEGFYPSLLETQGHHGLDVITGAGGNLTGNKFLYKTEVGKFPHTEEFGVKLIEDVQDAHPFVRKNRQFSDLIQKTLDETVSPKIREKADKLYTSIYDTLNAGRVGQSPAGKFWYNYLGGKQLNNLRFMNNLHLPGYKLEKPLYEWVPGKFWQGVNKRMAKLEVGQITGAKPFLMKTEVPYTFKNPDASMMRLETPKIILGHHSDNYVVPKQKLSYLQFFKPGGKTKSFEEWYQTVPENKRDTTNYNLRLAYELLPQEELDNFVNKRKAHLRSVAYDEATDTYQFLKSKNHPTLQKELDWYYSRKGKDFRDKYSLDTSGNYYKYIHK